MKGRLEGKGALITGGGTGIGRAMAEAFAREGARVVVSGRRQAPLDAVARRIQEAGGWASSVQADVSSQAGAERMVAETLARARRLDILVNNAALYRPAKLEETPPEAWDETLAVNLRGPYLLARAALRALGKRRGVVLNVSSNLALRPVPAAAAYAVSKAGLDMLTRVLALEGAPRGVRAVSILLGVVDTPIHASRAIPDRKAWLKSMAALHPLGRMGRPEDAAQAAVFLASDAASWITGALLTVDGGLSLV